MGSANTGATTLLQKSALEKLQTRRCENLPGFMLGLSGNCLFSKVPYEDTAAEDFSIEGHKIFSLRHRYGIPGEVTRLSGTPTRAIFRARPFLLPCYRKHPQNFCLHRRNAPAFLCGSACIKKKPARKDKSVGLLDSEWIAFLCFSGIKIAEKQSAIFSVRPWHKYSLACDKYVL